jgi:archaellum component FlaC
LFSAPLLLTILIAGCGPSEAKLESASALDSAVRQLNAICEDVSAQAPGEGQLSQTELKDQFGTYKDRLQEIRLSLASKDIVEEHSNAKASVDSTVNNYIRLSDARISYVNEIIDALNAYEEYVEGMNEIASSDSEYERIRALEQSGEGKEDFESAKPKIDSLDKEYERLAERHDSLKSRYASIVETSILEDSLSDCTSLKVPSSVVREARKRVDTLSIDPADDLEEVLEVE